MKPNQYSLWLQLAVICGLLSLIFFAVVFRGRDAALGITGGSRSWMCEQFSRFCPITKSQLTINFGVYDPDQSFSDSQDIAIDHYFVDWRSSDLDHINLSTRWPMYTVEPWVEASEKSTLLEDIASGLHDPEIVSVCTNIASQNRPVFIRFAHEMERVTGRYPWAVSDPSQYIAAYRHFVSTCRTIVPVAYYVWSPAGDVGTETYWPGHEYVDYVGLSLYHYPEFEEKTYGQVQSFTALFEPKISRVSSFQKPIIISEFGVTGQSHYQTSWIHQALLELSKYPQVKSLIYFNATDTPGVWGADTKTPDWHIGSNVFSFK